MEKIVNKLNALIRSLIVLLLMLMVVAVFLQVLFRFFLDQPLAWTEELSRYLLIWITFLGSAYAMSIRAHIGTEYILKYLSPFMAKAVTVIAAILSIVFFAVMVQQGYILSARSMTQTSPTLLLPMGYVYAVIPLSGALLIINVLAITWKDVKGE